MGLVKTPASDGRDGGSSGRQMITTVTIGVSNICRKLGSPVEVH